jgi:Flp pilus assembly protein TadD
LYVSDPPDYARAQQHGNRARDAYPADREVARALGIASYHQNDMRRAIELLIEVARQQPNDPVVLVHLGLAQLQLNRMEEARLNLERALELDPNGTLAPDARRALEEGR